MKAGRIRLALLLASMLAPALLCADGGVVCLRQASGPFLVTVFTMPAVLRAGPVDMSVMVQNRTTKSIILHAAVTFRLQMESDRGRAFAVQATRKQATNKLLQAAIINLPSSGKWKLIVLVRRHSERAVFITHFQVAPRLPRLATLWPFLILPPLAMLLFTANQALRHRGRSRIESLSENRGERI